MSAIVKNTEMQLRQAITDAVKTAISAGELPDAEIPEFSIDIPADRKNGDLAANVAMVAARAFHNAPRRIAEIILSHFITEGTYFERAEVAGPGFLNFFLSPAFYGDIVTDIVDKDEAYGRSDAGNGHRVMVEYVSANPTGPMHMGNARGGALGDCLASVLDFAGYDVWREFYINDAGNQIDKFGLSLEVRYLQIFLGEDQVELPEDAYHGDDIKEHAAAFAAIHGDAFVNAASEERRKALVEYALPLNIAKMKADMEKYRIVYDRWFTESTLHSDGELQAVIDLLTEKGLTYEKDGALWYKASAFTEKYTPKRKNSAETDADAPKDEVLVRANGNPTYFTADIAYHRNKILRGYDTLIDVWGADHHGHVARIKGALDAIGMDGEQLHVVLMQLVRLVRDGEVVRMSKRSGKAIQLSDLLDEVPVDAARFFFNQREANTQMEFDLGLAIEQSSSNPVYYVQYAHARIHSIFRKQFGEDRFPAPASADQLALLTASEERELIRHLAAWTQTVADCARSYDPSGITRYVLELATLFHKFYNSCHVSGEDPDLTAARLSLCNAVRITLRNALTLMKIDTPTSM